MKQLSILLISVILLSCLEKKEEKNIYHSNDILWGEREWDDKHYLDTSFLKFDMNPVNGIVLDTNNNGDTVLNISLKNGLIHGLWIVRREPFSGNKGQYFLDNYKNGKLDGVSKTWNDYFGKENILSEENYKNGELDGVSKVWNDYDDLIYEKHYKNGELDGVSSMWDSNGQLRHKSNYNNSDIIFQKCWDKDGNEIKCE